MFPSSVASSSSYSSSASSSSSSSSSSLSSYPPSPMTSMSSHLSNHSSSITPTRHHPADGASFLMSSPGLQPFHLNQSYEGEHSNQSFEQQGGAAVGSNPTTPGMMHPGMGGMGAVRSPILQRYDYFPSPNGISVFNGSRSPQQQPPPPQQQQQQQQQPPINSQSEQQQQHYQDSTEVSQHGFSVAMSPNRPKGYSATALPFPPAHLPPSSSGSTSSSSSSSSSSSTSPASSLYSNGSSIPRAPPKTPWDSPMGDRVAMSSHGATPDQSRILQLSPFLSFSESGLGADWLLSPTNVESSAAAANGGRANGLVASGGTMGSGNNGSGVSDWFVDSDASTPNWGANTSPLPKKRSDSMSKVGCCCCCCVVDRLFAQPTERKLTYRCSPPPLRPKDTNQCERSCTRSAWRLPSDGDAPRGLRVLRARPEARRAAARIR